MSKPQKLSTFTFHFHFQTMDSYVQFTPVPDTDQTLRTRFLAQLKATQTWTTQDYYSPIIDALENNAIKMSFYEPKASHGFRETVYGIIMSGHVDFVLEKLGKNYNWPRGFPIVWYPEKRIKFFGFRPKFKNDSRQKKNTIDSAGIGYFLKWSGFLGQPIVFPLDGQLRWSFASKNSLNSDQNQHQNNFVADGARIMTPYMTPELLTRLETEGRHFNVEVLSKNDQQHGAAVLEEAPIVTTLAAGVDLYLKEQHEHNPPASRKGFNTYHGFLETIRFCLANGLLVGSAVFATGAASKALLTEFDEHRDQLSYSKYREILAKISSVHEGDIKIEKGSADDHGRFLGDTLEGLVIHIVKNDGVNSDLSHNDIIATIEAGETVVEKYKLAPYVVLTMALRPAFAPDFKIQNFGQLLHSWSNMWCLSDDGREYWKRFAWQSMLHFKSIKYGTASDIVTDPQVGLHITIGDYIRRNGISSDIDAQVVRLMSESLSIVGEHLVVVPFADKSTLGALQTQLIGRELSVTFGKPPKNAMGWVKLSSIPIKPKGSTNTNVYHFPCSIPSDELKSWQIQKLADLSDSRMVTDVEELIDTLRSSITVESGEISDSEVALRDETTKTLEEITSIVGEYQTTHPDKKLIFQLIGPQCLGKSWIVGRLLERGDFVDASADRHMGEKFNPANLPRCHKMCTQEVVDGHLAGKHVVVDNTGMFPAHRTIYDHIAYTLDTVYVPILVAPNLWFTCSESQRMTTIDTLFKRSQAREALTSKKIPLEVIQRTIQGGLDNFSRYKQDFIHRNPYRKYMDSEITPQTTQDLIARWCNHFPEPDYTMGAMVDSMTLKYRSEALITAGLVYLDHAKTCEIPGIDLMRLQYEIWRGQNDFYATILNPREMKTTNFMKTPEGKNPALIVAETQPTVKGVGMVSDEETGKVAVFMVLNWPWGQQFRKNLGLEEKDFHVTLAFKKDDIHNQRKNVVLWS